ncbi:MAG: anti-sigma factor [Alteraurantiacibacter sp.]
MTDKPRLDAERALLAAEYALGFLEGAERIAAGQQYSSDPVFAEEVDRWTEEASGWAEKQPDDGPSAGIYDRIAAAVGLETPAGSVTPIRSAPAQGPGMWRPLALAASLAAVGFASLWLLDRPDRQDQTVRNEPVASVEYQPETLSIAQISSDDATSLVSALYDNDTGTLYVKLSDIPDAERVPQLWLLDSSGTPRSLGFGTRDANSRITLSADQRQIASEGGTIAISLEQPASAPHETPSDVLGAAQFAVLDLMP